MRPLRLIWLGLGVFLTACSASNPNNQNPELVAPVQTGFWTGGHLPSDDPTQYSPISYGGIDGDIVSARVKSELEAKGLTVGSVDDWLEDQFQRDAEAEHLFSEIQILANEVSYFARTGDGTCRGCAEINWPDRDDDQYVLLFMGVETPVGGGLRSTMAAFIIAPDGRYHSHSFRPYNFSRYLTENMASDLEALIGELFTSDNVTDSPD